MSLSEIRDFLLLCTLINYGILLIWFFVFSSMHGWLYKLHGRWFKLSTEQFDAIHYAGMAVHKIGVMVFNLAPLLALAILI